MSSSEEDFFFYPETATILQLSLLYPNAYSFIIVYSLLEISHLCLIATVTFIEWSV